MEGNVGHAFLVCALAGLATSFGAAIPFIRQIKPSDKRILATALALSAGVMSFVSFTEILQVKAVEGYLEYYGCERGGVVDYAECYSEYYGKALGWSYGLFFVGILICAVLDCLIHVITRSQHSKHNDVYDDIFEGSLVVSAGQQPLPSHQETNGVGENNGGTKKVSVTILQPSNRANGSMPQYDRVELQRMGLVAALALALHNVPEGIATFVATMAQEKVGIALGFAVAIHNIPEGVTVAWPIFCSTGSKWKGFSWATLSGCAEIIGGIIGYAIVSQSSSSDPLPMAVLFALVSGMMIFIVVAELLPTAFKYDESGKCVIVGFCAGMAIMAASLVLLSV